MLMDELLVLIGEEKDNEVNDSSVHLFTKYLRYTYILQVLDDSYTSFTNSQKRSLIKDIIVYIIIRLIDLRQKILIQKSIDCTDLSEHLVKLHISSSVLDFTTLPSFCKEDSIHQKERDQLVQGYMRLKLAVDHTPVEEDTITQEAEAIEDNEITLSKSINEAHKKATMIVTEQDANSQTSAAISIQRFVRGSLCRAHIRKEKEYENRLIGFSFGDSKQNKIMEKDLRQKIKLLQSRNDDIYQKKVEDIKLNTQKQEHAIREELRDDRITWLMEEIVESNTVPDTLEGFYNNDKVSEQSSEDIETNAEKDKNSQVVIDALEKLVKNYTQIWQDTKESDEKILLSFVEEEALKNQTEIERRKVDEMILINIQRIKSLNPDKGKSQSISKNSSKSKKQAPSKKSKKDMLPGEKLSDIKLMDTTQMLSILVEHRIINNPDNISLNEIIRSSSKTFDHTMMNQVKKIIAEDCILPLCCQSIRDYMDEGQNIRSILLYGPEGNGKTALVQAVASELGAILMNLSKIDSIFNEKNGATKLMHIVFTVARDPFYTPVVIYIDKCERFFKANKKKKKSNGPERFLKDLLIYKNQSLKISDRVIIIGCTSTPWEADFNSLRWKGKGGKPEKQGFFEKFLFINNPSYEDRFLLFKTLIENQVPFHELNLSTLSQFSSGHSIRAIRACIDQVLTSNRIASIRTKKLKEKEFLDALPPADELSTNNDKAFDNFNALVNKSTGS